VIEESDNPQFPLGAVIQSLSAMRSHAVYGPEDAPTVNVLDWTPQSPIPLSAYLTVFALSGGFTAMAGMTLPHLGNVKAGDVVLISAAAGHVGQLCCQIARLKGASKVIGIAGGDENCAFLKNELKVDEAIDYKKGNVEAAIKQAAPKGVNLYFDNVGREITNAVMNCMAMYGRIVCCGLVSTYNEDKSVPAVLGNFQNVLVDRLTIAGFICLDHIADIPNFAGQLVGWIQSGSRSLPPIEQEKGLENAIRALNRLLKGDKRPGAKMVVAVSAEPTSAS
jgi:NADPH-dependent curcumin reductase CurA